MEGVTLGAGLSSIGFWMFLAVVCVAGMWSAAKKRDTNHETLRRLLESDQQIDSALIKSLLAEDKSEDKSAGKSLERDLKISGLM